MREKDDGKKKAMREALLAKDKLPYWMNKFEAILKANGGKFFVGDALTVADLKCYTNLNNFTTGNLDHIPTTFLDSFAGLAAYIKAMDDDEKIKEASAALNASYKAFRDSKNTDVVKFKGCKAQ